MADHFRARIICRICGPVDATKVRVTIRTRPKRTYWANRCSKCGATFGAPPPGLPEAQAKTRRIQRRVATQERHGQLRLLPPATREVLLKS